MKNKCIGIICILTLFISACYNCVFAIYDNNLTNESETEETISNENEVEENNVTESNETVVETTEENVVEEEIVIEENSEEQEEQVVALSTSSEVVAKQTISDGVYTIATALNTSKILEIANGSTDNGGNLQIWENERIDRQKFKVEYLNNGYYKITSVTSSKVLDVAGGVTTNGTNVQQYESNGTNAQQWIIQELEDGYYSIISKCNGLYLDIAAGSTDNGTNVQVYEGNNTSSQKFKFTLAEEFNGTQSISDGIYYISSALETSKVLDISGGSEASGANLQIWDYANVSQQKYMVLYLGDGLYSIETLKSGKVLDVEGGEKTNGTNIQQYTANDTVSQQWVIKDEGNGYYSIISRCNGLYLDVSGGSIANGTNIQVYEGNGTNSQLFKFENIITGGGKTISSGTYYIASKLNTSKVLDVSGASINDGGNIQIWDNDGVKQQRFIVTYLGNGFYKMQCINSGKVLDVAGGENTNGTNVQQYTSNGTNSQQWLIKESEDDGYYYIISRCNELYLDVSAGQTNNGTNVQMYSGNNSDSQKFMFIETDSNGIDVSMYNTITSWSDVANAGIDFAICRVGYRGYGSGKLVQDSEFATFVTQASANGITCGAYFVTQATSYEEGKEEAEFTLNIIKNYNITGPVAIDVEWAGGQSGNNGRADTITVEARTEAIKGFCETIANAGYTPLIYASKDWLTNYINISELSSYGVWLAHYVTGAPANKSNYSGSYLYWQYTSSGSVSGISGDVDLDIIY